MATKVNFPPVKWAEREDKIYLTIDLQDVKDADIKIEAKNFSFSGVSGKNNQKYECAFELNGEVDTEQCKSKVGPRHIEVLLVKKAEGYWNKLAKAKLAYIQIDWTKWKDEDEDEKGDAGLGDFGGMGGGMGGMDFGGMGGGMGEFY
eukprot:c29275_g1_i1.p1 GENE.c29275_g1_i1~~c29275_g1_i1.p1  ORF type:complete len:147 (-),score=19.07 c29275_g1_i1:110-550(-)